MSLGGGGGVGGGVWGVGGKVDGSRGVRGGGAFKSSSLCHIVGLKSQDR